MSHSPAAQTEISKAENTTLPTSSDKDAILKQVEFYFGDNNLPYDKFLWTESRKNDGWVPIKTIHSFKRMRHFQPYETVVEALKTSPELLEVSEDNESVRRKTPLVAPDPEESRSRFERTVYAKNFGSEVPTSQFDIEKYFNDFAPTNQVRLRRADDGSFKSSVFVEFKNAEDAKKFVEQDPKPKFGEEELLVMSKQAYVEMKSQQHNFADKANGRRKPKFNAFKEMRHQESRNKGRNGRGKQQQQRGKRQQAPKRKSRDEDEAEPVSEAAADSAPDSKKPKTEETTETTEKAETTEKPEASEKPDNSDKTEKPAAEADTKKSE